MFSGYLSLKMLVARATTFLRDHFGAIAIIARWNPDSECWNKERFNS